MQTTSEAFLGEKAGLVKRDETRGQSDADDLREMREHIGHGAAGAFRALWVIIALHVLVKGRVEECR